MSYRAASLPLAGPDALCEREHIVDGTFDCPRLLRTFRDADAAWRLAACQGLMGCLPACDGAARYLTKVSSAAPPHRSVPACRKGRVYIPSLRSAPCRVGWTGACPDGRCRSQHGKRCGRGCL